eukprot:jgi/Galph1/3076/GphlegSOOS_G1730.1
MGELVSSSPAPQLSSLNFPNTTLGHTISSWWIGIILSICGSVGTNLGINLQKLAINQRQQLAPSQRRRLSHMPLWLLGLFVFLFSNVVGFFSFRYAAQSVLAGLSSLQFLSHVLFARFILKEATSMNAYYGTGLIILGCFLVVLFGKHGSKSYDVEELVALFGKSPFVCYCFSIAFLSVMCSIAYTQIKQKIARRHGVGKFDTSIATFREAQLLAVLFAVPSAVWGTFAVVLAKGCSMILTEIISSIPGPLTYHETYFILLGLVAASMYWMNRLNHALKLFDVSYAFPLMQIFWILFSLLSGGVYYEEFLQWNSRDIGFFGLGVSLLFTGVALICPSAEKEHRTLAQIFYHNLMNEIIRPPPAYSNEPSVIPDTGDNGPMFPKVMTTKNVYKTLPSQSDEI